LIELGLAGILAFTDDCTGWRPKSVASVLASRAQGVT
jgi:hypothetical protein